VADLLALQRSAGNVAVARLLQRQGWDDARKDPRSTSDGGWNVTGREVAGTLRIPVQGIKQGHQLADKQPATKETAGGRAIVVVPDGADLNQEVEVLLFFHGMGNVGYRERAVKGDEGDVGTVHDVEADRIPQQLASSRRNIVGVLPQGTDAARFGIADPQAYVTEVLGLALQQLRALRPTQKLPNAITPLRVIVSGHSGGGRAAVLHADMLTATQPAGDDEWVRSSPLFLFDGINGSNELKNVWGLVQRWLRADLKRLLASPDPNALLDRRGIKLRSTYTTSATYTALNKGGTYSEGVFKDGKPVFKEGPDGKPVRETVAVTIAPKDSLKGRIQTWIDTEGKALGKHAAKLAGQYLVEPVGGGHEHTVGTGKTPEDEKRARLPAPAGVTGPSKKAGVPDYVKGEGHLEQSLSKLPPDALIPPPPPPAPAGRQSLGEDVPEADEAYA
jgi:hypothetical protein